MIPRHHRHHQHWVIRVRAGSVYHLWHSRLQTRVHLREEQPRARPWWHTQTVSSDDRHAKALMRAVQTHNTGAWAHSHVYIQGAPHKHSHTPHQARRTRSVCGGVIRILRVLCACYNLSEVIDVRLNAIQLVQCLLAAVLHKGRCFRGQRGVAVLWWVEQPVMGCIPYRNTAVASITQKGHTHARHTPNRQERQTDRQRERHTRQRVRTAAKWTRHVHQLDARCPLPHACRAG